MNDSRTGRRARGHLIRELLRLLRALDSKKAKTVKEISFDSGMELRQTYRWLEALDEEKMVEKFDRSPLRVDSIQARKRVAVLERQTECLMLSSICFV